MTEPQDGQFEFSLWQGQAINLPHGVQVLIQWIPVALSPVAKQLGHRAV